MREYAARVCPDGRIQTVKEHTIGVCQRARRDALLLGLPATAELICLLHDMGKNTANSDEYQHTVGTGGSRKGSRPIHSHAGAKLIYERYFREKGEADFCAAVLSELTETVVMAHHGLFDCLSADGENTLLRKIRNDDYDFEEARRLFFDQIVPSDEADALFSRAAAEIRTLIMKIRTVTEKSDECLFYFSMVCRMLLSILVNADHSDAAAFASGETAPSVYGDGALWTRCAEYFESKLAAFEVKTPLQRVRGEISDRLRESAASKQTVVRLTVPTGGGKTLSGLRYAVNYARRFQKSRIIYVAPFNSILEQNSAEYKRFLPGDAEVLEHFGDMIADDASETSLFRYYAENWGSPVITTSMVQFLNTLFLGKISSVRRMRGLLDSVIILDEIQSVPVECISLFNLALNFLAELCGCTVVLCSATQPSLEEEIRHKLKIPGKKELLDDCSRYSEAFRRTKIIDSMKTGGYSFEETAEFVLKESETSKSVLLIVNTRDAAKSIYTLLKELTEEAGRQEEYLVHLSAQMCPAHRKKTLNALKERLNGEGKVICVSTQLIEAGVDISFETVIRSSAGLDSVIQSAGRCNRNGETALGAVHVINISDEVVSRLASVKTGAAITERLLLTMRKNPDLFGGEITSPEAVNRYYRDYFDAFKSKLDYPVKAGELTTDIFRLLSANPNVVNRAMATREKSVNLFMNQSFKTAGDAFQVIGDYRCSVLTPYGEGSGFIRSLCSESFTSPSVKLLRELQPYTIALSPGQCEGRTVRHENTGLLILKEGYYNSEYGFDPEGDPGLLII